MARTWRAGFGWFLLALALTFVVWAGVSLARGDTAGGLLLALIAVPFLLFGGVYLYFTRITRED